jgi:hypothetical protein
MIIEHGDLKNPTGNAVIFWHLKGNNKILKKAGIIASNFVVSPLQSNEETLMVNFPPVLIDSHEKLIRIAEMNNIDLIRGGEIFVPEDITDFTNFYKKQIEKYNGIIREYLLAFKEKNSEAQEDDEGTDAKGRAARGKALQRISGDDEPGANRGLLNLPLLIGQAGQILASIRGLIKSGSEAKLIDVKIGKLREIQNILKREMGGVDLERVIEYVEKPYEVVDTLVDLHMRKLLAVFLEDYETAEDLKKTILSIEQTNSL